MTKFVPTIGLEIHAQLKTKTKMFCRSRNDPDEKRPNVNVCPVCLAHPGALPTINKEAVKQVLRVGIAVGGKIADDTEFDRKNYFYPDIPKGYQISQYQWPLVSGGALAGVRLTRIHLEEDTARSQHDPATGESLIDFNRAGVPLLELVTEPRLGGAKEAGNFARELQLLLRYLDSSEANMEKGEMRVEANVSLGPTATVLGTKVEVKNLNSFRAVERAIDYEIARQRKILAGGGQVAQETRGWDDARGVTFSQRQKESAHDYRYFPDPDLPKLKISAVTEFKNLAATLPELPWQKRQRLAGLGFLQAQDIAQLVGDFELGRLFDAVASHLSDQAMLKTAANLILNYIAGLRRSNPGWTLPNAEYLADVVQRNLPAPQAKSAILSGVLAEVADADSLPKLVDKIIAVNPKVVADYQKGKQGALQFLVGQSMKESKGAANPEVLQKLLRQKLSQS